MKKMRIQLLDSELRTTSDRLVVQDTEFMVGPKEKHDGAISIELQLHSKDDVVKCKEYLDKLVGDLPLDAGKRSYTKAKPSVSREEADLSAAIKPVLEDSKDMDTLVEVLREEHGFVFVSAQYIEALVDTDKIKFTFKKEEHKDLVFLVKMTKRGKVPASDRYDWRVAIGFELNSKKDQQFVYELGKLDRELNVAWKSKKAVLRLKKKAMTVFPKFMTEDEREKYRTIQRKQEVEGYELSKAENKFFIRWSEWVKKPDTK